MRGIDRKQKIFAAREIVNQRDYLRPQRWSWHFLTRTFDRRPAATRRIPDSMLRRGLRMFTLDGIFSSASDNLYTSFVVLMALGYGATSSHVGVMTAITNLTGMLALVPGAMIVGRIADRKRIVVSTGGGIGRLLLLGLILLPLFTVSRTTGIVVIVTISALRAFMGNFANPAWTSLVADLVPRRLRGLYFSRRSIAIAPAALIAAPVGGYLIRHLSGADGSGFLGYQVVFSLALVLGMIGTLSFARIPEPGGADSRAPRVRIRDFSSLLRTTPGYAGFLVSTFVWHFSVQTGGPFFDVYLVKGLGGTSTIVGLNLAVSTLASIGGLLVFGPLSSKRGNIRVQRLTGFLIPVLPALWLAISRPLQVLPISFAGGFLWAGFNLAHFNLLLEISPPSQRAAAAALFQITVFAAAVLGPLFGGMLIDAIGFRFVFIASAVGRLAGIVVFAALIRPRDTRT
ncbi:MAG: MFS transporter [Spirochaetales bacterium]|nr:MFS transporter [Spirochaetales bacterium]